MPARMNAKHQLEKLKDDYAELHGRAMLYLAQRDEARALAREFFPYFATMQDSSADAYAEEHPWLEEKPR